MRASPTASARTPGSTWPCPTTAPMAEPTAAERAPGKQRDPFFDNAKYLAIVLVAIGHSWEPLRSSSRSVTALYTLVYAVHMPAFIVISGYFSRSFRASPTQIRRLLTGVFVPYVVFETAYTFFTRWTDHQPDRAISLLDPLYLTWFLAALFVWRLTTPIWTHVRRPLPIALAIAMLATLSPSLGNDLDLQRLLQFLPYFVLGLCLKPEHFQLVRRPEVRQLAVPVFVCALAVAYWAVPRFDYAWLFHNASADQLGVPDWEGPVMTLALFFCSTLLVACFPRLGAAPPHLVHRAGRGHAVRLSPARIRRAGRQVLGLVRPFVDARPPRRGHGDRGRRRRRDRAVHTAGAAGVPVRDGTGAAVGAPP